MLTSMINHQDAACVACGSACVFTGYIKETRKPVTDHLFKVVKQLRAEHAVARGGSALQIIAGAKIPIIKVSMMSYCLTFMV